MSVDGEAVTHAQCALLHSQLMLTIEQTLDGIALAQLDIRKDLSMAISEARAAKEQAARTNGRVTAMELWRAAVEGGGKVLNFQVGLLFGSGVLMAAGLFVAGLTWG